MEIGNSETLNSSETHSNGGNEVPGIIRKDTTGKTERRGRPPGSKNRTTPLETGTTPKIRANDNESVDTLESAKFIGTGFVALLELAESMVHSSCANRIEKKLPDKLIEFRQMCENLAMKKQEKELIEKCATKIAERHELMTKYAPELVLAVTLGQYSLRQMSVLKFTDNVTKKVKEVPVTLPTNT